jgi:hypothetical protein
MNREKLGLLFCGCGCSVSSCFVDWKVDIVILLNGLAKEHCNVLIVQYIEVNVCVLLKKH